MKVKLLEYEAEVEWISSKQTSSFVSHDSIESIGIWFTFAEPVSSTIGFGIEIPPREYTEEENLWQDGGIKKRFGQGKRRH